MAVNQMTLLWRVRRALVVLMGSLTASAAFGATSTFVQIPSAGTSGTWNDAASWAAGDITPVPTIGDGHPAGTVPNAVGDVAVLQQLVSTNGGNVSISLGSQTITFGA